MVKKQVNSPLDDSAEPDWPTQKKKLTLDGRAIGINNSVWLYRRMELGPVSTASNHAEMENTVAPLNSVFHEIAKVTTARAPRRSMAKGRYRDVHALLVNIPERFDPVGQPLERHLRRQYPNKNVQRRLLMLGVRLTPKLLGGGWRSAVDSVVDTFSPTAMDVNMAEYDADYRTIDGAFSRAGWKTPSPDDFRIADSWWNAGMFPDTPYLVHEDHLHMFRATDSLRLAAELEEEKIKCNEPEWDGLTHHHTLSMVSFSDFTNAFMATDSSESLWAKELLDLGAAAISIRGKLEPRDQTRNQLRVGRKALRNDINDARTEGSSLDRADQTDKEDALERMEAAYSRSDAPPTLIEASIVAALNGSDASGSYNVDGVGERLRLSNLALRQERGLAEMMMCSQVRANPNLKDLPTTAITYSGLPSLSIVGDKDGALLGFTEGDEQPAYVSSSAAYAGDSAPLMAVIGQTGSGKTMVLLWLATQWAQRTDELTYGVPQIIVDPKTESDHSLVVEAVGGRVRSLDELQRADGVFDPLRFSASGGAGVDAAASILLQVDPWQGRAKEWESDLAIALNFGVQNGATCIGQALLLALEGGVAKKEMVDPVINLAENGSPFFRACVGLDPKAEGLRVSNGITLIKAGSTALDLPTPGQEASSLQQRICVALVRMMVFGSAMALTDRQGVLHFDEAWVAMAGGAAEVERLGRLARSQNVLPILYTQRVSDMVKNGLTGYISRGIILAIEDREEAQAACDLFKLEPTEERLGRITAKARRGGGSDNRGGQNNWNSLRPLFEYDESQPEQRGRNVRGSVGIYVDLNGRAVPTVVQFPPEFLEAASTNPFDVARRKRRIEAANAEFAREQASKMLAKNAENDDSEINLDKPSSAGDDDLGAGLF